MSEARTGWKVVVPLGLAQTIGWGSSYYIPAILAKPVGESLNLSPVFLYGMLSMAMIVSGLIGPRVGMLIDRWGGRGIMCLSNFIFALGLILLGLAQNLFWLILAWLIIGIGMGSGLYEAAFASLTRLFGFNARKPITGITLIAGFASTVSWPLTAWLEAHYGWRITCFLWAGSHLLLALPLNRLLPLPEGQKQSLELSKDVPPQTAKRGWAVFVVGAVFTLTGIVGAGLSAILPGVLVRFGVSPTAAIAASTLIGPMQFLSRFTEAGFLSRFHPLYSARLACILHPIGSLILALGGPVTAPAFVAFYAAGNGILTISRGTLPLILFGPEGYGKLVGYLSAPSRLAGALSPFLLGLIVENHGLDVLWLTCSLSMAAFMLLLTLPAAKQDETGPS